MDPVRQPGQQLPLELRLLPKHNKKEDAGEPAKKQRPRELLWGKAKRKTWSRGRGRVRASKYPSFV